MSCNCNCSSSVADETETRGISRRSVVAGAGLGAAALGLAACSSNEDGDQKLTDDQGPTEPTDMIAAADVPVGGVVKATSGKLSVMIAQPEEGTFKAYSSICTHQGCQLNVQGKIMACPCHASQFSPEDGSVMGGPAPDPLPEFKAEVSNGRVIVSAS